MSKCIFSYDNLWADPNIAINYSTQHPNFPATNSRHRDFTKPWKSRHGVGSGWGQITIEANVNDRFDFQEAPATPLAAILTPGVYNADTINAHLKAQMEAVGGSTYTPEYVEIGDDKNHFQITSNGVGGTGIFELLHNSGANKARSISGTLGFDVSADDTGSLTYLADYIRIHTEEYLGRNLGVPTDIYGVIIQKHNIQTAGMVQIWGSNLSNFSTGIKISFTIQDDILVLLWAIPYQYQYWRFHIEDPSNPAGYVEMRFNFLGPEFRPTRYFSPERTDRPIDPSLIKRSEGGQVSTIQRARYFERDYEFQKTDQKPQFEAMFKSRGFSKGFFFCEDSDNPLSSTFYAQFVEKEWEHVAGKFWNLFMTLEKLR